MISTYHDLKLEPEPDPDEYTELDECCDLALDLYGLVGPLADRWARKEMGRRREAGDDDA